MSCYKRLSQDNQELRELVLDVHCDLTRLIEILSTGPEWVSRDYLVTWLKQVVPTAEEES